MNKTLIAIFLIFGIVGISVAAMLALKSDESELSDKTSQSSQQSSSISSSSLSSSIQSSSDTATPDTTTSTNEPGIYENYSADKLSANKKNILFFAANWCPSCKQLDDNLQATKSQIPSNVNILKVDYDSSQDLKKKYGVTLQHTLVQVDENGELIKKWNGLYDQYSLDDILAEII